ncbi:cation:proton antiporter [Citricoccus nitrophenolicus]|uniref:cation:proton antiporter n=1 Tax=Citricoccus nitrophenolicus TaxID=863575 RepID=UPI00360E7D64
MTTLTVIGQILIVLGGIIFATAALGLVRFPDAYTRISAVGTAGGIGIVFVVVGALCLQPTIPDLIKVIAIVFIHLGTSAIGTMAIARSTHLNGTSPQPLAYDELTPKPPEP